MEVPGQVWVACGQEVRLALQDSWGSGEAGTVLLQGFFLLPSSGLFWQGLEERDGSSEMPNLSFYKNEIRFQPNGACDTGSTHSHTCIHVNIHAHTLMHSRGLKGAS